jgi:alpha/beta superfamily hydrolase
MSQREIIDTADGQALEARFDLAANPTSMVVFCHPHPLDRGTMNAPLMIAVTLRLVERGFSVLRFNFRGTGESTGSHDQGDSERLDVAAAVATARERGEPVSIAGWSFGAAVALSWLADKEETIPYVGIAPMADRLPEVLPTGPKRIILGHREQVIDGEALLTYCRAHTIECVLTPGDHFFHGRGNRIGDLVAEGLTPRS